MDNDDEEDGYGIFTSKEPTNCLWYARPKSIDSVIDWHLCPKRMNLERSGAGDGKIFICGGTAELECWAEIYDPLKQEFKCVELPDNVGYPCPSSSFLWNQRVMIYFEYWTDVKEESYYPYLSGLDKEKYYKQSLLSYDIGTGDWEIYAYNLPSPHYPVYQRNCIYVGGDILFIIDHACRWYVYNLSSKETVGEVRVEGVGALEPGNRVIGAFYAGNNDIGSTSWVFFLFWPQIYSHTALRYAKVEVVQGMDMGYTATVKMGGLLNAGPYVDLSM